MHGLCFKLDRLCDCFELFGPLRVEKDVDAFHGVVSERWDLRQSRPKLVNLPVAAARLLLSQFEEPFEIWVLIHEVTRGKGGVVVVDF